jgi:hypothetical protein
MTVPPFSGASVKSQRWLNILMRRWLTPAGNQCSVHVLVGNTTLAVTFLNAMATFNYGVSVSVSWNTTVWVTAKSATGCTLNFSVAAPNPFGLVDIAVFDSETR